MQVLAAVLARRVRAAIGSSSESDFLELHVDDVHIPFRIDSEGVSVVVADAVLALVQLGPRVRDGDDLRHIGCGEEVRGE